MFILNPYDRYFQKSNTASKAPPLRPLHGSTNSPLSTSRRLMDSITRSRKASPILSVTTALATTPAPQAPARMNCIPFPSFPLSIHCGPQLLGDLYVEGFISIESTSSGQGLTWPIDIQQARPQSCAATEAHFAPHSTETKPRLPIGKVVSKPTPPQKRVRVGSGANVTCDNKHGLKKALESAQYRKVCKGEKGIERKRSRKAGKKAISDVKFLLALHKNIACHVERADEETDVQGMQFIPYAVDTLLNSISS